MEKNKYAKCIGKHWGIKSMRRTVRYKTYYKVSFS